MSSGSSAEPLVGLDAHLLGPAELVEVVDVGRAEVRLERVEDVVERHAQRSWPSRGRCRRRAAARRRGRCVLQRRRAPVCALPASIDLVGDAAAARRARRRRGPRAASGSRRRRPGPGSPAAGRRRRSPPGSRRTRLGACARIASWLRLGSRPLVPGRRARRRCVAAFDGVGPSSSEMPPIMNQLLDARRSPRGSRSTVPTTSRVRSSEAASGSWTPTIDVALVLGRQEARRAAA